MDRKPMDTAFGAKAIEMADLGDRVGPEDAACADPALASWREVDLVMTVDNHGERDDVELRLLRPEAWFREHRVAEGSVVALSARCTQKIGSVAPDPRAGRRAGALAWC